MFNPSKSVEFRLISLDLFRASIRGDPDERHKRLSKFVRFPEEIIHGRPSSSKWHGDVSISLRNASNSVRKSSTVVTILRIALALHLWSSDWLELLGNA